MDHRAATCEGCRPGLQRSRGRVAHRAHRSRRLRPSASERSSLDQEHTPQGGRQQRVSDLETCHLALSSGESLRCPVLETRTLSLGEGYWAL
eukprot:3360159-Prymnesium_polylepis.1